MAKRTINIRIKLPSGVTATKDLTDQATKAAKDAVDASVKDISEAVKLAKDLAKKGIDISAEELMDRKVKSKPRNASKKTTPVPQAGKRKRVVLNDAQKKSLIADLKSGAKIAEVASNYGVSPATVMNLKAASGLTKKRK